MSDPRAGASGSRAPAGSPRDALRLGVLVPCRDEALVVARRIANLARLDWPSGLHRLVVVDDGSVDGTLAHARRALAEVEFPASVAPEAVTNSGPAGKAGAIGTGLAVLTDSVDVVVLTDADVVFRENALVELADAFGADPALGMACGAQEFVRDLSGDGRPLAADGASPRPAGGLYDRWTSWVRAWESRAGRLFSVHGQCLAWRTSLGIAPTPGVAADDLDLMLQVRAAGAGVRLVPGARFLEVKTPPGPARESQALRRARAYFQCLARPRPRPPGGWTDALQWYFYRHAPGSAPLVLVLGWLATVAVVSWGGGVVALLVLGALTVVALLSRPGRGLVRLLSIIERARRSSAGLEDRWEMPRT